MSFSASETVTALWGGRVVVLALLLDLASDGNLGVPVQVSASFCVSRLSKDSR